MKKQMKALFAVLVVLSVAAGVFAGGSRDTSAAGPVTLDFWFLPTSSEAGPPPADWKAFQIVKDKLNINWTLSMLPSSAGDRQTRLNAAAAANTLPDLFYVDRDTWQNLVKTGLLASVDDLYTQIPTWSKIYGGAAAKEYTKFNGKSYAISYMGGGQPRNEGMLIRKDWLDKLGLSLPKTTQ